MTKPSQLMVQLLESYLFTAPGEWMPLVWLYFRSFSGDTDEEATSEIYSAQTDTYRLVNGSAVISIARVLTFLQLNALKNGLNELVLKTDIVIRTNMC